MLAGHREAFRCGQQGVKRQLLIVAAALVLAACSQSDLSAPSTPPPASRAAVAVPVAAASTPTTVDSDTMARYDGYGDMRFGIDEAAFEQAWGGELKGAPGQGSTCFYKTPKWVKRSADFAFMFEGGRFVRYDVGTTKEAAPGGGKVGMDEMQIRTLYGARVEAQPHKYVAGAKYLRITAPGTNGVLLFETDAQGKITRWRVGVPPQVDYVEGCG
jgi:hypothetical protein